MAQTIYIKNSEVAGVTPSSLAKGEIAINIADGNLFYGDAGGNVSQNFSFLNSGATSIGALTATSGTFRSNVNISGDTRMDEGQKFYFNSDGNDETFIQGTSSNLRLDADDDILLYPDDDIKIGEGSTQYAWFYGGERQFKISGSIVADAITGTTGTFSDSLTATSGTFNNNLNVSGVTKLASSVLTTADINGGTIDGTSISTCEIAASDITVGAGKTLELREADAFNTSTEQKLSIIQGAASNIDIGAYEFTAKSFKSDVATGIAPFIVASTTVVANLHVASATSVMTNANLTGDITSVGNATSIASGVIINADVKSDAAIDYSKLAALSDGNILVGNGSNVATSVNPSGDIDVSNAGVFSIASGVVINADVKSDAAIDYSKLAALSDGNILVGNGSNVATSVNPSGDIDVTNAGVFSIASGVIINADVKSDAAIAQTKLDTNVDLGGDITFGNQLDDTVYFKGDVSAATVSGSYQYVSFFASVAGSYMTTNDWIVPSAGGGVSNHTWNNNTDYLGSNNTVGTSNFTPGNGEAHLGIPVPVTGFLEGFFCNCRNNGSASNPRNGGLFVGTNDWGVGANAYTLRAYAAGDDEGGSSNSKVYKIDGMLTTGYPVTKGDIVLPALYSPDSDNVAMNCTWTVVFKG